MTYDQIYEVLYIWGYYRPFTIARDFSPFKFFNSLRYKLA